MHQIRFVQTQHEACIWTWAYVTIDGHEYGLGAYPAALWPSGTIEAAIAEVRRWLGLPRHGETRVLTAHEEKTCDAH